jgi:hypothetical protein|tara:strand:+ start:232 stop:513 length:282 start_codon:yes stop_codon:yes gene_type:complete
MAKKKSKKDACYHKVKSRYKVWPSAYASGALSKCRKVGAKNWGNKQKKAEGGVVSAIDNPKRPPKKKFGNGGFTAAGCGSAMQESKRQVTRIF